MNAYSEGIAFFYADPKHKFPTSEGAITAPVFDLLGSDEIILPKDPDELIIPYEKFWVLIHEKHIPNKAMYFEGGSLDNNGKTLKIMFSIFEEGFHATSENTPFMIACFTYMEDPDFSGRKAVNCHIVSSNVTNNEMEEVMLNNAGWVITKMALLFSSKEYRLIETTPVPKAKHKSQNFLEYRPIIRSIKIDDLMKKYKANTGATTGVVMPPHPRRAHWRVLRHPRFKEVGKKIFVAECAVNGWEWKDSKGVSYKLI